MLWWTICTAELRRGWLIRKRYPLDLLFSMAGGILFLVTVAAGAMLVMGGRMALDAGWAPRVWGLVLASMAGAALSGGIGYINSHTYSGTLEQVALSPVPLPGLVVLRQVTSLVTNLPYLVAYAAGLYWFFPGFRPVGALAVSVVVTWFGMMGMGMVMAGLCLMFQQVQSVLGFVTMLFYPLPLLASASVMASRLWGVLPYGLGLQVAMGSPVDGWLVLLEPLAWVVEGYAFLRWADIAARRKGVLGLY
jgi:ABC-2 type transport system permease protein